METKEAPKKIYVDSKAIGDNISTSVRTKPQDYPTCTEYTRTDAFIEKACEWLEKNVAEATGIDSYAITESFKQAMENNL